MFLSNGNGTFSQQADFSNPGFFNWNFTNLKVGDFNADGKDDFLRQETGDWAKDNKNMAQVFVSNGNGTFSQQPDLPNPEIYNGNLNFFGVGDFDGDGADDLLRRTLTSFTRMDAPTPIPAVLLNDNHSNDLLTGGVGKDTLTGGAGRDRFDYRNLGDSLFDNFDVITDFNANNDLFLVSTARTRFSNAGSVATLDTNGIAVKLTTATFTANAAAQFSFGSRTFVAINDDIAGFGATTDAIIEVTGLIGTLGLKNFTNSSAD